MGAGASEGGDRRPLSCDTDHRPPTTDRRRRGGDQRTAAGYVCCYDVRQDSAVNSKLKTHASGISLDAHSALPEPNLRRDSAAGAADLARQEAGPLRGTENTCRWTIGDR